MHVMYKMANRSRYALQMVIMILFIFSIAICTAASTMYIPPNLTDVNVTGGFWLPRIETNRLVTVRTDFEKCEIARIPNFTNAAARTWGTFKGIPFDDSDVYKVIEGAAYTLATHPNPKLEEYLDRLIDQIAKAQEPDGYLYTARTLGFRPFDKKTGEPTWGQTMMGPVRWSNCSQSHELYNVGHMYEAAVAYLQATGKRSLLNVAIKSADLIDRTFGFGPTQIKEVPGHEEIELALCKLYRTTGEKRYLALAKTFLDMRGRKDLRKKWTPGWDAGRQDHIPVTQQREAIGHAVRAGYLYCGMADVAALTGDTSYLVAIDAIWENVVGRKLHLNGGIGAYQRVKYSNPELGYAGEAFGDDFDLPNENAYLETCAAIANALWNERMFLMHGDAKYMEVLERTLYNGVLSGISLSGDEFFYPNPLASKGGYKRSKWFDCSCCPGNIVRFIPQVPKMAYAGRIGEICINLFMSGRAEFPEARLTVETDYPWSGDVKIAVEPKTSAPFTLKVRIPGWAQGRPVPSGLYTYVDCGQQTPVCATLNGETVGIEGQWAVIRRAWKPGDTFSLSLPMKPRLVRADSRVKADVGRLAVECGPVLYCAEAVDNGGKALDLVIDASRPIVREGSVEIADQRFPAIKAHGKLDGEDASIVLIPYFAWCHRGDGEMQVWLKTADAR